MAPVPVAHGRGICRNTPGAGKTYSRGTLRQSLAPAAPIAFPWRNSVKRSGIPPLNAQKDSNTISTIVFGLILFEFSNGDQIFATDQDMGEQNWTSGTNYRRIRWCLHSPDELSYRHPEYTQENTGLQYNYRPLKTSFGRCTALLTSDGRPQTLGRALTSKQRFPALPPLQDAPVRL